MYRLLLFLPLLFLVACNGDDVVEYDPTLPSTTISHIPPPQPLMFRVEDIYPHDPSAFTQGLEIYKGKLYEGTGEFGHTKLRITHPESGAIQQEYLIPDKKIFGEGITIMNGKIYQLTWQNQKIFEYNADDITQVTNTYTWNQQGWGLTNNGKELIISDGSSRIYFATPDPATGTMKINKILTVINHRGEVDSLNELEMINGYLYANIWMRDDIVKIDTANGHVMGVLHLKGLMQQFAPGVILKEDAVLNGIAYDSTTGTIYITGKDWPKLFALKLQ